ncbi:MAG: hypothetical protein ACJ748_16810 [Flavisolibacter sp.]
MIRVLVIFILSLLFSGCKKNSTYMDSATITGFDPRMGICEGGILIKIDGHSNPNGLNGQYDIDSLTPSFRIDNSTYFPLRVTIDWNISNKCYGNYINITRIKQIH